MNWNTPVFSWREFLTVIVIANVILVVLKLLFG